MSALKSTYHTLEVLIGPCRRQAANDAFGNPVIDVVLPQQLLSTSCRIATIDCVSVSRADLQNVGDEFRFESMLYGPLTGFVLWFTAVLLRSDTVEEPIVLDTGPHYAPTHWAQTVLYLKEPRDLRQLKQGQIIGGRIVLSPSARHQRFLDIAIQAQVSGDTECREVSQTWTLSNE
mmetsp:Transcript_58905/g.128065  ORF Transcript_58905/g.128065 Transcript_58905/m.128065 type:complete len:176 (-) Transcript_58905:98-625(-)